MRSWWNWQTRTFEGRMRKHMGSSPIDRTKNKESTFIKCGFFIFIFDSATKIHLVSA